MRRVLSLVLVSLLCATGSTWLAPVAATAAGTSDISLTLPSWPPIGETRTLYGTLTQDGVAIAGAVLAVTDTPSSGADARVRTVTTNAAGAFSFDYASRSKWDTIIVHYAGDGSHPSVTETFYLNSIPRDLQLDLDGPTSVQPLTPVTISGTLTSGGSPVPGVEVEVSDNGCGSDDHPNALTTDEVGRFTFSDTPLPTCLGATYWFDVQPWATETYDSVRATQTVTVDWVPSRVFLDPADLTIRMGRTATWTGGVLVDGVATADQPVTVTVTDEDGLVDAATVTTDQTGRFTYSRPFARAGGYAVHFAYAGTSSAYRDWRVLACEESTRRARRPGGQRALS